MSDLVSGIWGHIYRGFVIGERLVNIILNHKVSKDYKPWRPIGLREVKAPTLLRQTANRWRQGCQPYAPAARYPQVSFIFKDSWYSFLLEAESKCGRKD
jgi:hypothetical protein